MSKIMRSSLSLALAVLLCLSLFTACLQAPAQAEGFSEPQYATIQIEGKYISPGDSKNLRSWLFPYSDSYFLEDENVYHHKLAQASLGMALSAFRNTKKPLGEQQENILSFLNSAGFENLRTDGYDQKTAEDTIASMIGSKKIGDFTLVAVAVCGGGYGNEWKSNFLVEDETLAAGFNHASQLVQERIRAYLTDNNLSGDVRLWIAGYSRAAAVSNITAAGMTDSGLFSHVFAYTFATPNTTREKGNYTNIFNIIGKTDPVPCVPLRDWGYEHYGTDLYTPAQEYDSDYNLKAAKASAISYELTGKALRNNPVINHILHNVLDYLLAAYPSPAVYQPTLGASLIEMWGSDSEKMLESVEQILFDEDSMPEEQAEEFDALLSYVEDTLSSQVRNREKMVKAGLWDDTVGMSDNIAHEHNPDIYVDWLFSSNNPDEIFSSSADSFYRFVLYGDVELYIYDAFGYVMGRLADGTIEYNTDVAGEFARSSDTCPELFIWEESGTITVLVPKDRDYGFYVFSENDQEIKYFASTFTLGSLPAKVGEMTHVKLNAGEGYVIYAKDEVFYPNGDSSSNLISKLGGASRYSPSTLIQMESMNILNLTLNDLIIAVLVIGVVLAVLLVVEIILLVVRLIRHKRRKSWVHIITCGLLAVFFFTLAELSRYHLNAVSYIYIAFKALASLCIAILGFTASVQSGKRLSMFIFFALLFAVAGDISPRPLVSLMFFAGFLVVMIAGFLLQKQYSWQRFLVAGILWLLVCNVCTYYHLEIGNLYWYFIVYSAFLMLLPVLSWKVHPLLFIGCLFFCFSNILIGMNIVFDYGFVFRAYAVGYYLLATFTIAISPFFMRSKKNSETADVKELPQAE